MMINKFENLKAWQKSKQLAVEVYKVTSKYPSTEVFSLTSQTNRAVVSVPANIAEGCSRASSKDFSRFLEIAVGSAFELKTLLDIAHGNGYLVKNDFDIISRQIEETLKIIYGLRRSINDKK